MEYSKYKFDEEFLREQINEGKDLLLCDTLEEKKKEQIKEMISMFNKILGFKQENKTIEEKKELEIKDMCLELEKKLNTDLKKIDISFWQKLKCIYLNMDKKTFKKTSSSNNINFSTQLMLDFILDFYKDIDHEYYKKAMQIIQMPTPLINFDENSINNDQCFFCEYLSVPFINIKTSNDEKYCAFVHELQHGIEFLLNGFHVSYLYSELSPIFFETIFIDTINELNSYEELYNLRINDHVIIMEWINQYTNILISFVKHNKKITKHNILDILNVKNKEELERTYNMFIDKKFIDYCKYALSFMKSLEIREKYVRGLKKLALTELKNCVSGKDNDIDFSNLIKSYNNYVSEIKEKHISFQKNVK